MALIQAAQNQKQTKANLLKLKIGAKVMLAVNIDMQYLQMNGQTGNISHIEFAQGSVCKVYVKMWYRYLNKERLGISIHQAHSFSFHIRFLKFKV